MPNSVYSVADEPNCLILVSEIVRRAFFAFRTPGKCIFQGTTYNLSEFTLAKIDKIYIFYTRISSARLPYEGHGKLERQLYGHCFTMGYVPSFATAANVSTCHYPSSESEEYCPFHNSARLPGSTAREVDHSSHGTCCCSKEASRAISESNFEQPSGIKKPIIDSQKTPRNARARSVDALVRHGIPDALGVEYSTRMEDNANYFLDEYRCQDQHERKCHTMGGRAVICPPLVEFGSYAMVPHEGSLSDEVIPPNPSTRTLSYPGSKNSRWVTTRC